MKKIMISIAVALVCISACAFRFVSVSKAGEKELQVQSNQIADLKNQLDVLSNSKKSDEAKLQYSVTGLQSSRKEKDDAIAEEFLKKCLTWDSGDEYDAMREELFTTYHLDENGSFATVFLPKNVKSNDGKYNYIDTHHANSQYEGMESYVSNISTDGYSYFTYVVWSASDLSGNEASSVCIFTYDVTVNGDLINLNAYTIAE